MPDLCTLGDVKTWLGITNTASDALLSSLISSTSQDFVNEIRRPSIVPTANFSDVFIGKMWPSSNWWNGYSAVWNWNCWQQTRKQEIYLSQYPVNSIATVTLDGTVLDEVTDPTDLTQSGWFFDGTLEPEDRQKIALVGLSYFGENSGQRLQIDFNAGYAQAPLTISQAVVEWVAFKRGQSQLQSANQAVGSFKMGDYEQTNAVSGLTLAVLKASIPENVQRAIDQYRKQIPF